MYIRRTRDLPICCRVKPCAIINVSLRVHLFFDANSPGLLSVSFHNQNLKVKTSFLDDRNLCAYPLASIKNLAKEGMMRAKLHEFSSKSIKWLKAEVVGSLSSGFALLVLLRSAP